MRAHAHRRGSASALLLVAASLLGACRVADDVGTASGGEPSVVEPDLTIGLVEGDSSYLFGDIRTLAADALGRVYVGDRIGATIRVYDSSGSYLRTIAREGGGPGEIYGWPADITFDPSGRLYVRDGSRLTVFVSSEPGGVADSVGAVWPIPGYGNLSSTRAKVSASGEYFYPDGLALPDQLPRFFYRAFASGEMTGDTLEVPPHPAISAQRQAFYRLGARDGRLLDGLSYVPFAAVPVWDVTTEGTILSSDGSTYQIVETDERGDTVQVLGRPRVDARPVPVSEAADSAGSLAARLDSIPVPLDQVIGLGEGVREQRLPAVLPAVIGIYSATDGAIWVERWPRQDRGDFRYYDVFDRTGTFRASYELGAPLRRDPPPHFGARYVVGVVADPATDVERVVRFDVSVQR